MKVSIVINNFNYGRYVAAAIESALAQTYRDCEVIVVDDGSTDESRDILCGFADRVRVVLKGNGGQASALNAGFRAASGDLLAFLDSDDLLFPKAIETAVRAAGTNFAKVQFPLEVLDEEDRPTGLRMPRGQLSEGLLVEEFIETGRYVTSPTSGNVFCRRFLERVFPIPESEFETADGYLNTCAPFFGKIVALEKPLGFYRVHGESLTSVVQDGAVQLEQMKRLMRHAVAEKDLLARMAHDRGLELSKRAVFSHWMHLKLSMSLDRLSHPAGVDRFQSLMGAACEMAISVFKAHELSALRKIEHIVWALAVATLPAGQATKFIEYAFDRAPSSQFSRFVRRM